MQRLKHSGSKGDKNKKKEVTIQIAQMQAEVDARQEQELKELENAEVQNVISEKMSDLAVSAAGDTPETSNTQGQEQRKKVSKAGKRRNKKAAQAKAREDEIRQYEVESSLYDPEVMAKIQEKKSIISKLAARSLQIFEVPSDGDCLYSAISRLLKERHIQLNVSDLRQQTAQHMRQHPDDFTPFLCNLETGDSFTPDEYSNYCDRVETTAEWGSQVEIRALSNVLRLQIDVVQGDGADVIIGEEHNEKPLVLTYHRRMYKLGEHYNATATQADAQDDDYT